MADEKRNDPLDERLRATFAAERADMERRRAAGAGRRATASSPNWLPLAAAAAVIAVLAIGVAIMGSRAGDDEAVDVDVAAQPTEEPEVPQVTDPVATPTVSPTASSAAPTTSAEPEATPTVSPDAQPPAANGCGEAVSAGVHFVWDVAFDDPDGGLVAHAAAGVDEPVTRVLPHNAVVGASSGCVRTADGATWRELGSGNGGWEWVNGRYLRAAREVCVSSTGTPETAGDPFFHTIAPQDRLQTIADMYNVTVDSIIAANPRMDPNLIVEGEMLLIPDGPFHVVEAGDFLAGTAQSYGFTLDDLLAANPGLIEDGQGRIEVGSILQLPNINSLALRSGPIDAWAVFDDANDDVVAAIALPDTSPGIARYVADPTVEVTRGRCGADQENRTPVCLTGEIVLRDTAGGTPIWTGSGPTTAWRTSPAPAAEPGALERVELLSDDGETRSGVIDPAETPVGNGQCIFDGETTLASNPCTRVSGADRTAGFGTDEAARSWSAGDRESIADHVHDMTAESNGDCTRLVITFGQGANEDETVAASLPPVFVHQNLGYVSVLPDGWPMESAFDDPMRIDYLDGAGIGLLTVSFGFDFSAEFMHPDHEPHVRFFENPARVVIDLFPSQSEATSNVQPFGDRFVLRRPLQPVLDGPGVPADQPIRAVGYGRPFEAAGLYRIWSVPPDVDVDAFLADPGEPLHEDFFPTSGWAEAWGQFEVTLPELEPGSYIAVFGELPPTDEIGFYGVGQLFHVYDPDSPPEAPYPASVLLPNVQFDPEF